MYPPTRDRMPCFRSKPRQEQPFAVVGGRSYRTCRRRIPLRWEYGKGHVNQHESVDSSLGLQYSGRLVVYFCVILFWGSPRRRVPPQLTQTLGNLHPCLRFGGSRAPEPCLFRHAVVRRGIAVVEGGGVDSSHYLDLTRASLTSA